ncbi:sialin-like [Lutzomyia longipalpis]|uniref:sialin-like n=1 Tax=Lutzomyia longipalpis TaxID=7200 RepID=UPI002483B24E|nr:sialin-like [Lutzomyia longipalpis]
MKEVYLSGELWLKSSLSVALVAMTKVVNVTHENGTIVQEKEFNWNSKEQGYVLSSFFYGCVCTQFLGGMLANRFRGHIVFGIGIGGSSFLTILSPFAAKFGIYALITIRIIMGLIEGVAVPAVYDVINHWTPKEERTTITGITIMGTTAGVIFSFMLSGQLAEHLGWESIFYVLGGLGCVWFIIWMIYIKNDPASDPRISPEEKAYIEANVGVTVTSQNHKIPWRKIVKSPPVYAVTIAAFSDLWITCTFLTQIPTYLDDVLHYNLGSTGFLAASPFILQIIVAFTASIACDRLRSTGKLTTEQTRKMCLSIGLLLCGFFLFIMANLTDPTIITICLNIAVGSASMIYVAYMVNPLDFAPNYATLIIGISNTVGIATGIISPILTGYIVQEGNSDEWKIIFYIAAGLAVVGTTVFTLFAEGEVQEWAKDPIENHTICRT